MRIFLFFSWLKGGGKRRKETAEGYGRGVREKAGEREGRGDEKQVDARGWLEKRKTLHTEEGLATASLGIPAAALPPSFRRLRLLLSL